MPTGQTAVAPPDEVTDHSAVRAPHPALADLVDEYHGYRITDAPPGIHHGVPSRVLTVVIAFDDPLEVGWLSRVDSKDRFWIVASGLATEPAAITHNGRQLGIQLGLSPAGARALLGVPASEIARTLVPLSELVGRLESRLYDAVAAGATWDARFAALDHELLRLLRRRDPERTPVSNELHAAWRWLGRHVGAGTVDALSREIGWSRRHLTQRFRAEFGIGPKEVARIARFERARAMMIGPPGRPLAEIAATCGFADQAHLTREWRTLTGYSPTQWQREEAPFVQDLAAAH